MGSRVVKQVNEWAKVVLRGLWGKYGIWTDSSRSLENQGILKGTKRSKWGQEIPKGDQGFQLGPRGYIWVSWVLMSQLFGSCLLFLALPSHNLAQMCSTVAQLSRNYSERDHWGPKGTFEVPRNPLESPRIPWGPPVTIRSPRILWGPPLMPWGPPRNFEVPQDHLRSPRKFQISQEP